MEFQESALDPLAQIQWAFGYAMVDRSEIVDCVMTMHTMDLCCFLLWQPIVHDSLQMNVCKWIAIDFGKFAGAHHNDAIGGVSSPSVAC